MGKTSNDWKQTRGGFVNTGESQRLYARDEAGNRLCECGNVADTFHRNAHKCQRCRRIEETILAEMMADEVREEKHVRATGDRMQGENRRVEWMTVHAAHLPAMNF